MKTATFSCPHCSSPLRIRDRAFVEREVGCPDCGERIEVTLDRDKEPVAHKITAEASKNAESPAPKLRRPSKTKKAAKRFGGGKNSKTQVEESPAKPVQTPPRMNRNPLFDLGEKFSGVPAVLLSPVGIAWTVAGLVAITLLIMAWPEAENPAREKPPEQSAAVKTPEIPSSNPNPAEPPTPAEIPAPDLPENFLPGDEAALERRLTELGISIKEYSEQRGQFPRGTVAAGDQGINDRLSWLAELIAERDQGRVAEPQWDQPWHDPLNDRFVRRQQESFLNPAIPERTGADRYPATHFVGVAGVGADAPLLAKDHRRAGIFGADRITRTEDIKDGTANTMLVAGVSSRLGSWAAGGTPTMRAFTKEPYFDGPDGFGTGQANGMSVLMADGSVRFLSQKTAPVIIRRMAAMNDGFPLDETIPGEPGENPAPTPNPPVPPVIASNPPKVIPNPPEIPNTIPDPEEPKPEPEKPIDIAAALAVNIVKFDQVQDVPFQELLFQVEELCGVPIRPAKDSPIVQADVWKRPVSLRLKDTTVKKILEALLEKANLRYTVETNHILLHAIPKDRS